MSNQPTGYKKLPRIPLALVNELEEIYAQFPPIECQRKCQECCSPIGDLISELERARLVSRTGIEPNRLKLGRFIDPIVGRIITSFPTVEEAKNIKCVYLGESGECTVHDIRPAICRVWGISDKMSCSFGCKGSGETPDEACRNLVIKCNSLSRRKYE